MRSKILVVDDYEIVRKGLRALLKGPTLEVVAEAPTGEEALQKVLEFSGRGRYGLLDARKQWPASLAED